MKKLEVRNGNIFLVEQPQEAKLGKINVSSFDSKVNKWKLGKVKYSCESTGLKEGDLIYHNSPNASSIIFDKVRYTHIRSNDVIAIERGG